MIEFTAIIDPCAAPRQSRRDSWKPSKAVQKYRRFKDALRAIAAPYYVSRPPDSLYCRFYIPMPAPWSAKKKCDMSGKPMRSKPDGDNLIKAVADGLWPAGDAEIWDWSSIKQWANGPGYIEITVVYSDN